jgi:hypothetical protein
MRPAGGGQVGQVGSPQGVGARVLAGTGGERQEAQAPRWLASGLVA